MVVRLVQEVYSRKDRRGPGHIENTASNESTVQFTHYYLSPRGLMLPYFDYVRKLLNGV